MTSLKRIGVIGAGTMGQAIAEMLGHKGLDVYIAEKSAKNLEHGLRGIEMSLDKQIEKWALTEAEKKVILSRMHAVDGLEGLADCELIIETISEDLDAKKDVFRRVGDLCGEDVILASNTSTLSLTELAGVARFPARVIGLHFIHPVSNIDMVEVIRGLQTSDDTFQRTRSFVEDVLSKKSILVYESPGFVTTRLICTLINEAMHTLAEGVASAEDIDNAMRLGYGFKHGPLEMADRFGLDAVLAALERMFRDYGDLKYRPAVLLRKMVRAGQLGVKTGYGFFRYDEDGDRI
ncbi:3-hydroxyacyl-CoA dehydrogenase family protein [Paenibacillus sp.]|uniref:3-hydroxyacyl-CoA dehydrogenase family protein n=1 Tax=Paenibacillus sp. TaxID=58172 RepID=UPI002D54A126|nr:3-hydroxyacyl-CoA dehydrogenase NAD-binding domain-containing protein [Paenibacillus sp.]HZG85288.1 3-hydroxyacyl-CoA dehydrogenase NAD-binding domain-containing protein [Paenibacillus sp.]